MKRSGLKNLGRDARVAVGVFGIGALLLAGASWRTSVDPAAGVAGGFQSILGAYPASLKLHFLVMAAVCGIGIPLGVIAGGLEVPWLRRGAGALLLGVLAVAPFWLGMLLIESLVNHARLPVIPPLVLGGESEAASQVPGGWMGWWFAGLPASVLAVPSIARVSFEVRRVFGEVLADASMTAVISRGLGRTRRVYRYALPASRAAILRTLKDVLPFVISGSLIVEWIFRYPGVGTRCFEALESGNHGYVLSAALLLALSVVCWRAALDGLEILFSARGRRRQ